MNLEIAVSSIEAAITAQQAGAHRIELCDNLGEGGTTPSYGTIKYALENLTIPVYPIIRPRGGDFFYTQAEMQTILYDIELCKNLNCKGIVVGMLLADGTINLQQLKQVKKSAGDMHITFHRAFDRCANQKDALHVLINEDINTVLTSGGQANAIEGAQQIADLIQIAGNKICIMPGAGVRANNLQNLISKTKATYYHSSAGLQVFSKMNYINTNLDKQIPTFLHTNATEIKEMLKILQI